jgi:phosphoribosylformylglycinamidine synthase I
MIDPEFAVLVAPGTNCESETEQALRLHGASPQLVNINDLRSGERTIDQAQGMVIPGGFSYGDIIRAGAIFATDLRDARVADQVNRFAAAGKPIVGTCNGFQVLVESGLLPNGEIDDLASHEFTLDANTNTKFECRWVKLLVEDSLCQFIDEEDSGTIIELPVAHAEGRFLAKRDENYQQLLTAGQVVLRYCNEFGDATEEFPANPNGSPYGIAGICSPTGTIFGMMPHDERFFRREHHPNWRRQEVVIPESFSSRILRRAIAYALSS